MAAFDYDLLVIGSGPAGLHAAIQASQAGKRVAVVERDNHLGGVCINTGTIPSKTLRETVLYLTGYRASTLLEEGYTLRSAVSFEKLLTHCQRVIEHEHELVERQLVTNRIELVVGDARFVEPHRVSVSGPSGGDRELTSEFFVIAVGTRPSRPEGIPFDDRLIIDSDDILRLEQVPRSLAVIGAGIIGCEYASMFAALGTRVTVVERHSQMLTFCDPEVVESLKFHLRDQAVTFRFSEEVAKVEITPNGTITSLASGKRIAADMVMYSAGRQGVTDELDLEKAGLAADPRGRITVDGQYRTAVAHIFAVGDVIGFPALAATSMNQGRLAAYHAFGEPARELQELQPIGIYTVPEISYCGRTEAELTQSAVPYEVGMSRYRELARGAIVGDSYGMLKLLVSTEDRTLLGVHVFGTNATDLVHIGQAIMGCGGTVDYLVDTVFNYPTLSEAYKVAALDVTNKIRALDAFAGGA